MTATTSQQANTDQYWECDPITRVGDGYLMRGHIVEYLNLEGVRYPSDKSRGLSLSLLRDLRR